MRKNHFIKTFLITATLVLGITLSGSKANAAETQFNPTTNQASAPVLGINNEGYFAVTNGVSYASFVTPAEEGFIEVEYKNISIDGWAYAGVYSHIGEKLALDDCYKSNSTTFRFKSESGKRNNAQLEPNTRYFIQVGKNDSPGNVKIDIHFTPDNNPDGKGQSEDIQLNTAYTRSIDGYVGNDDDNDFFKFTASSSGAHHFTITNSCGGWLNYSIRKWNSDEYVKTTNNYDMKHDTYLGNTSEFDINLEAGQTYYLEVWHSTVGNYTFSINNQCVQSITMPTSTLMLGRYETYTLSPTVSPDAAYNKTLSFSSSNENVACVDSSTGKITAYQPGKAIITATATDGSNTQATCFVYVTPDKPSSPSCEKSTNSSIKLKWYAVDGADGYYVYRKVGKQWKQVKTTTGTTCTIKKLSAGTSYQFRIKAYVNADGKKYSTYSDTAKIATTPKKTSITSISRLNKKTQSYGTTYRAKIKWKKVAGATSYKLYYKAPGYSSKYLYREYTGTSATVEFYRSKSSTGSKKYTFYIVPVKKYGNNSYTGSYSKGVSYTLK